MASTKTKAQLEEELAAAIEALAEKDARISEIQAEYLKQEPPAFDVELDEIEFDTPDGEAVYRWTGNFTQEVDGKQLPFAGKCGICGLKTYACTSHPIRADEFVGQAVAVFCPAGPNQPPQVYCQDHDPNVKHALMGTVTKEGIVVR